MNHYTPPSAVCSFAGPSATPSRYDNPFATCWTRPGALAFRFSDGETAEKLIAQLAAQSWRGAIIGPHGSGKSTLLETLKPALSSAGVYVRPITLQDGQRRLPRDFFSFDKLAGHTLVIVDGYEQLGWLERVRLWRRCHRLGLGLLITGHAAMTIVPMLLRLRPDRQLIEKLVADLASRVSTEVARADVFASHACHGSNVREIFFDLYDRHERLRRSTRTCAAG